MYALSFGEILWDIIGNKFCIGGAPFNLVAHLAKMGFESHLISSVGRDKLGEEILKAAEEKGINISRIQTHPHYPTGTVTVTLNKDGHPAYVIHENVAWDDIVINSDLIPALEKIHWDVFCFGTLAQRSEQNRKSLAEIISHIKAKHFFYDVNFRQNYYDKNWITKFLSRSTIVKMNEEEAAIMSHLLFDHTFTWRELASALVREYNLTVVCITCGDKGCVIFQGGRFEKIPGTPVTAIDTVGAGDAFSAGFLFSYILENDAFQSARFACKIGSYVASQTGAVPEYSKKIKEGIKKIRVRASGL